MRRIARLIPLALWIAAIAVLLVEKRPLAAASTVLLAAVLFLRGWRRWNRLILISLCLSLCAHSIALLTLADRPIVALTIATSALILFWRSRSRVSPGQIRDLRTAMTWVLMVAALLHFAARGSGSSVSGTPQATGPSSSDSNPATKLSANSPA
ncbi:MAG TPA: hypothetical protein VKS01_05205 [Bryobacteraceae bacterium]|nr:hypothetical protein [Bryobacteraceae bacterium]